MKVCHCAVPSLTGNTECCKKCSNNIDISELNSQGSLHNSHDALRNWQDIFKDASDKLLAIEYSKPDGSEDNPYYCIVSPMAFKLILSLLKPEDFKNYETDMYGRSSFITMIPGQGWTKIVEQGSSEDCVKPDYLSGLYL